MTLNHKDAMGFLVGAADEIGFNRYTFLNLHALLANNLLADPFDKLGPLCLYRIRRQFTAGLMRCHTI